MKSALFSVALVLLLHAGYGQTEDCLLPEEPGLCKGYFPRYNFDRARGQCKRFIYGGCGGNGNNFPTLQACEERCTCFFPKETGPCKARIGRYYFNHRTGKCEKFYYGGCLGNVNRFRSIRNCNKTCASVKPKPICYQPKKVGPCRARRPRYFYNKLTKKCEKFYYGGCRGNQNNFKKLQDCRRVCV
ncbi:BPTI/Kunitz domain-containing protein-like isoform X2 [Stylophora pistillata]|nr:BPTI/Kunitz domain-containing protein-like isoform X2 [Stylophora pistillata]